MFRRLVVPLVVPLVASLATALPASPASAGTGWHSVQESWQPYEESGLLLPADRYCGDFDLQAEPLHQRIRSKVLTRWDDGGTRTTVYAGPLITENTNLSTGESVRLNLSGRAITTQREDGSLALYETRGPVGMGFPTGSIGLEQGFYQLRGRHVVEFPESGPRRLVVDQGPERDVCDLVG